MPQAVPQRTVILKDEGLRRLEGFTQIPNVVLTHPTVSGNAKMTYGVLLSYAWQKDFCWPAQERLSQDMSCSVRTVQRYLTELEQGGLIRIRRQGLNLPNVYEILPISSWHNSPQSLKQKDTTDVSHPDTTEPSALDTTAASPQEATPLSHKEYTPKNIQVVVNDVTTNDPKSTRPSASTTKSRRISDRALQSTYQLTDEQIGRVHWLVEKQTEVLGHVDRNHGNYVKRAAEAVRDGQGDALDHALGDFKQAATEIAVTSRPAYFHALWAETTQKRGIAATPPKTAQIPRTTTNTGPERIGGTLNNLFPRAADENGAVDPRIARLIADAESRGFPVPDHIRNADIQVVNLWWAALAESPASRT